MKTKLIIATVFTALFIGIITSVYAQPTQEINPIEKKAQVSTIVEPIKREVITITSEPVQEPVVEVSAPVAEQPVEVVIVKSSQEYAEQYLDLSGDNQACFDIIITEDIPQMFTESIREHNIKKIVNVFNVICSSNIVMKQSKTGVNTRHFTFFINNLSFFND